MNSKIKKISLSFLVRKLLNNISLFLLFFVLISKTQNSLAINLISDAEIESGIKHIVTPIIKVTGINPDEMNIFIVLNDEANAFAISGNNIFINTGLLTLFNDVNVLKGVFAHELGHVTGGHIIRRQEKLRELYSNSMITSLLGVAAILGGAGDAGAAIISGSGHSLERNMMRFNRENEYSADQAAYKYLRLSENSPEGLIKILRYFNSRNSSIDLKKFKYMMTHPLSSERLYAADRLGEWPLDKKRNEHDQQIYNRIYAKLQGFIADPNVIIEQRDSMLTGFARQYELAIAYFRLDDLKKSLSIMDSLIKQEPKNGYLYELKAQFLFESGHVRKAVPVYERAVQLQMSDDLVKLEYAVALINAAVKIDDKVKSAEYYKKAISQLNEVIISQPQNPWAFRNLAIAYGRVGQIGASNLMLAEEALLYDDIEKAEMFINLAKKKGLNNSLQVRAEDIIKNISNRKNK